MTCCDPSSKAERKQGTHEKHMEMAEGAAQKTAVDKNAAAMWDSSVVGAALFGAILQCHFFLSMQRS